jgi:hypothetical protein
MQASFFYTIKMAEIRKINPVLGSCYQIKACHLSNHSAHVSIFSTSSSPTASEVRKRTRDDQNEDRFKKDGKIHSFKQGGNDDDENNTWNGNSTQQM